MSGTVWGSRGEPLGAALGCLSLLAAAASLAVDAHVPAWPAASIGGLGLAVTVTSRRVSVLWRAAGTILNTVGAGVGAVQIAALSGLAALCERLATTYM